MCLYLLDPKYVIAFSNLFRSLDDKTNTSDQGERCRNLQKSVHRLKKVQNKLSSDVESIITLRSANGKHKDKPATDKQDDDLEKVVNNLETEVDTEHGHDVALAKRVKVLDGEYGELASEVDDIVKNEAVLQELDTLEKQYRDFASSFKEEEDSHATKGELETIQLSATSLSDKVDEEHQHDVVIQNQIQLAQQSIQELELLVQYILDNIGPADELTEYEEPRADIESDLTDIKLQMSSLQKEISEFEDDVPIDRGYHISLDARLEIAQASQTEHGLEEEKLRQNYTSQMTTVEALYNDTSSLSEQIEEIADDYVTKDELMAADRRLSALESQMKPIKATYIKSTGKYEVDDLRRQIGKNTADIKTLEDNVYYIHKKIHDLHKDDEDAAGYHDGDMGAWGPTN